MKKHKSLNWCLLLASTACIGLTHISLTSCNKQDKIVLATDTVYTTNNTCSFNFSTNLPKGTAIHIKLADFSENTLSIVNPDITVGDPKENHIDLLVSDSVKESRTFIFSLFFSFPQDKKVEDIIIEKLKINFTYQPIEDDGIKAIQTAITNTNSYVFNFAFVFQNKPKSDVEVKLVSDPSGKLSLKSWGANQESAQLSTTIKVELYDYRYYAELPIYLQVSVFEPKNTYFALNFSFTNSKGVKQNTTLSNFTASLAYVTDDTIPEDFFNIVVDEDNKKHLIGFKNKISQEQLQCFSTLQIPDSVDVFDSLYLYNSQVTPDLNLNKIVIGKNLSLIKKDALENCKNIAAIDTSLQSNDNPFAFEDGVVIPPDTFDHGGVIIIPEGDTTTYNAWSKIFQDVGFTQDKFWEIYDKSKVIPETYYNIQYNETIKGDELVDIDGADLSSFAVIDMPSNVVSIKKDAFDKLRNSPFIPDPEETDSYGNRYLLISQRLKQIEALSDQSTDDGCFSNLALTGLINIPRRLMSLPNKCFNTCDNIIQTANEFTQKKCDIRFNPWTNLDTLGSETFKEINLTNFTFPNTITYAESGLLSSCRLLNVLDFSQYTNIPGWTSKEGGTTSVYFSGVGTQATTRTIIVSDEAKQAEGWEKAWRDWLQSHGLQNPESWIFK